MQPINLPTKDNNDEINHENLTNFLTAYSKSNDYSMINPSIQKNKLIFCEDSQIPDIWAKTRCPLNKNLAFFDYVHQENSKGYSGKQKKPLPSFFPIYPFKLPACCELSFSLKKKENSKTSPNLPLPNSNLLPLAKKIWLISMVKDERTVEYGPYGTEKIRNFLNFAYLKLSEEERKKRTVMIVDKENDVHYLPETLIECFQLKRDSSDAFDWNQKFILDKPEEEKKKIQIEEEQPGLLFSVFDN